MRVLLRSGISLLNDPAKLLRQVAPLTRLIEDQTGLAPSALPEQALAFIGVLLLGIGEHVLKGGRAGGCSQADRNRTRTAFYSGMSVYTLDEKFKRNSSASLEVLGEPGYCIRLPPLVCPSCSSRSRADRHGRSLRRMPSSCFTRSLHRLTSCLQSLAQCTKTPNGNSLLALYSALNVFTGLLMGFTGDSLLQLPKPPLSNALFSHSRFRRR